MPFGNAGLPPQHTHDLDAARRSEGRSGISIDHHAGLIDEHVITAETKRYERPAYVTAKMPKNPAKTATSIASMMKAGIAAIAHLIMNTTMDKNGILIKVTGRTASFRSGSKAGSNANTPACVPLIAASAESGTG